MSPRIKESLRFFQNYLWPISVLFVLIYLPLALFMVVYAEHYIVEGAPASVFLPPLFAQFFIDPLAAGALIFMVHSIVNKTPFTLGQCLKTGLSRWVDFIIAKAIAGIVIALGLMAFILPGMYFFYRFIFIGFFIVIERSSPIAALGKSFTMTQNRGMEIVPPFLLLVGALVGLKLFTHQLLIAANIDFIPVLIALELAFAVLESIPILLLFRFYQLSSENERKLH